MSSIEVVTKKKLSLFSGTSSPVLAADIAKVLNIELGKCEISRFSNGEIYIRFLESVRGCDVFVLQTCCDPINDNILELLIMIDALKRASAKRISAIIPFFGYARQDRKTSAREPITAKLFADILTTAGADRVLTMDLHAGQLQGFFNIPVDHLTAVPLLASYFLNKKLKNVVAVSPDIGGVPRAFKFAERIKASLAILNKRRPNHNIAEVLNVIGEVEGKSAILIDDMIDTGGSISEGVKFLISKRAKEVYVAATHPIFSGDVVEKLTSTPVKEIVVTDTLPIPTEKRMKNLTILSISKILAETIYNVYTDESVSQIFEGDNQI